MPEPPSRLPVRTVRTKAHPDNFYRLPNSSSTEAIAGGYGFTDESTQSNQALTISLKKIGLANKPASEFNNFYTPNNTQFYSRNPYQTLDVSRREIRLLKVFPRKTYREHLESKPQWTPTDPRSGQPLSEGELEKLISIYDPIKPGPRLISTGSGSYAYRPAIAPSRARIQTPNVLDTPKVIACELVDKVPLSKVSGAYHALSYCAGDPTDTTTILVDGLPFNAFANLEHAIGCALDVWTAKHPGKELLLWADQVSINQVDDVERGTQVGMMRDIYRRSKETFVCLSNPRLESNLSWATTKIKTENANEVHTEESEMEHLSVPQLKDFIADELHIKNGTSYTQLTPWLDQLETFLDSPLWCRSWIYQELVVSRPCILSGPDSVLWSKLSPVLQFICKDITTYLEPQIHIAKARATMEYDEMNVLHCAKLQAYQLNFQQYNLIYTRYIKSLEKNVTRQIPRAAQFFRLRDQFVQAKLSECEGLIGHNKNRIDSSSLWDRSIKKQLRETVEVLESKRTNLYDYRNRFASMSKSLATLQGDMLKLLRDSSPDKDRLDLKKMDNHCKLVASHFRGMEKLFALYERKYTPDYNFSDELSPVAIATEWESFRTSISLPLPPDPSECPTYLDEWKTTMTFLDHLQTRFRKLKTSAIHSIVDGKVSARWPLDLKVHLRHSRNCKASDPRDRVYAFLGLANPDYGIMPSYPSDNTIIHVLIDTSRKIIEHEKTLDILKHVSAGRHELGYFLPSWVADWTSPETNSSLDAYLEKNYNAADSYKDRPFNACKGLPAEVTFNEDKSNASNMDMMVKGVYIGRLRDLEGPVPHFPDLQSFLMNLNYRIITSVTALVDDEVWVLHGASKPVVLRPEGLTGRQERYSYLFEGLIYRPTGIFSSDMFGGIIGLVDEAKTRELCIL